MNDSGRRSQAANGASPSLAVTDTGGIAFLRLCHLCFHLNESPTGVYRCEQCGRVLTLDRVPQNLAEAVEQYFENEMSAEPQAEQGEGEEAPSDGAVWVSAESNAEEEGQEDSFEASDGDDNEDEEDDDDDEGTPEDALPDSVHLAGLSVVW